MDTINRLCTAEERLAAVNAWISVCRDKPGLFKDASSYQTTITSVDALFNTPVTPRNNTPVTSDPKNASAKGPNAPKVDREEEKRARSKTEFWQSVCVAAGTLQAIALVRAAVALGEIFTAACRIFSCSARIL